MYALNCFSPGYAIFGMVRGSPSANPIEHRIMLRSDRIARNKHQAELGIYVN
jgi:hypothetical protein